MQRPTFLAYSQYDEGKAFCIWPVRKDTLQYIVQMIYNNNTLQYRVYARITKFQYLIKFTSKRSSPATAASVDILGAH